MIIKKQISDTKRTIKKFIIFAIFFAIMFGFIILLIRNDQKIDQITVANWEAHSHHNTLTNIINLEDFVNISSNEEYYIIGEYGGVAYYMAYAGDLFEKDTLIFGDNDEDNDVDGYWAIKIKDKVVTEAWSANYPMDNSQLHAYSWEEQKKQASLFKKINESKVIGYYHAEQ